MLLQTDCRVTAQPPLLKQQAPGCGQGLGEQTPPSVHVLAQVFWSVTVHEPAEVQHVPGCGQGFGEQTPVADHVPLEQPESSVIEQVPAVTQQTPGCAHGLGEQKPRFVHVALQPDCSVTEHAPWLVQQEPVCGQGLGVQDCAMVNVWPVGQEDVLATHAAVALSQQTPAAATAMLRLVTPGVSVLGVPKPQTPLAYCMKEDVCAVVSWTSMLSVRGEKSVVV